MSRSDEQDPDPQEQFLQVVLKLSNAQMGVEAERARIWAFAEGLDLDVQATGAGELDGCEFGEGEYLLSFCSQDVDRLMEQLRPLLRSSPLGAGGHFVRVVSTEDGRWDRMQSPI